MCRGKYTNNFKLFKERAYEREAVQCLNDMVTDALRHVPDCVEYLTQIKDSSNFLFCAIPQVMAAYTLAECFNNPNVFRKVVKIRRGLTAKVSALFEYTC